MLIGQQVGPFLIEKELGAGAMGAVYRGKYVKTGLTVAIKVMAPNVGTNRNSLDRFKREADILKQLKHPNIVRYYGAGTHKGMPFYAMEFIQGETLDRVIARRDRMTWEQVVDLGKQLCAALQHAHEAGVVHRDLKPSNLMITADGTLKLTDFGIAKDLDETGLTATNSTVGTAAYMSPEQCTGKEITPKSDLYSLGVVLYELLTGRKPFQAETAVDMFMLHIQGVPVRPSRLVPELPPWMDTLVVQLLEKRPDQRPRDALMVGDVLASIQDKVEAQASAGVEAASARRGDRPRDEEISDEDRDAARALLGKKPPKKKKKDEPAGFPMWILQATGLVLALIVIIGIIIFAFQPPSPKPLFEKIEKLRAAGKNDESTEHMEQYLKLYGKDDTPETEKVRKWLEDDIVRDFEEIMGRHVRHERGDLRLAVNARNDDEKNAFAAAVAEYDGDAAEAIRRWNLVDPESPRVGLVAKRHLAALASLSNQEQQWKDLQRKRGLEPGVDLGLDAPSREAFAAWRQQKLGDRFGAQLRMEKLRNKSREPPGDQFWALYAATRAKALKEKGGAPQTGAERVKAVTEKVDAILPLINSRNTLSPLRVTLVDVVELYKGEDEMVDAVRKAQDGIKKIDEIVKPGG
jgi:serine/threonine-protein kinase